MKEPLRLWMPDDKGEMQVTLLEDEHAEQYVYLDDYRELESKLSACEKERDGQKGCADAYFNALVEIRQAMGLTEHDDHVFVTDEIKRLVGRLGEVADMVRDWKTGVISATTALASLHSITAVERHEHGEGTALVGRLAASAE